MLVLLRESSDVYPPFQFADRKGAATFIRKLRSFPSVQLRQRAVKLGGSDAIMRFVILRWGAVVGLRNFPILVRVRLSLLCYVGMPRS